MPSTDPFQPLTPTGEVDRAVQGLKNSPAFRRSRTIRSGCFIARQFFLGLGCPNSS
jgi:hypothetical protein